MTYANAMGIPNIVSGRLLPEQCCDTKSLPILESLFLLHNCFVILAFMELRRLGLKYNDAQF
jgi:hypothetical protein